MLPRVGGVLLPLWRFPQLLRLQLVIDDNAASASLRPERRTAMLKRSCKRFRCFFLLSRLGLWSHISQIIQHQASQHFLATSQSNQVPPSSTFMFQMCSFEWYLTINYNQIRTKVDTTGDVVNFNIVELVVFGHICSHTATKRTG